MTFRLVYSAVVGDFDRAFKAWNKPIAAAAVGALRETADQITTLGRRDIAAGGFTSRWQRGLTVKVNPTRNPSTLAVSDISAKVRHRLPYIAVFENGATIRGKPFLWLPLPGVPKKIGGKRTNPRLFARSIGPLNYVARAGKSPLLVGPAKGVRGPRVGLASLRRGAAEGGVRVPIFVGVRQVKLRKRIHVNAIVKREVEKIQGRYHALFDEPR